MREGGRGRARERTDGGMEGETERGGGGGGGGKNDEGGRERETTLH